MRTCTAKGVPVDECRFIYRKVLIDKVLKDMERERELAMRIEMIGLGIGDKGKGRKHSRYVQSVYIYLSEIITRPCLVQIIQV